jgi:gamma-glutamylputrescine oxidase
MTAAVWRALSRPPRGRTRTPTPLPPSVDVAVVGAGLTGLSCAYHVLESDPDARVAILDAAQRGAGASGHTTGMVTPGVGQDFAALVRRLGRERAAALYAETRESVRHLREIIAAERIDCGYERVDQLVVAHGQQGEARLLRQAAALDAAGQPCLRLDAAALARRVNLARVIQRDVAALALPDAATVDPLKLVYGLANAVEARGASLHEGSRVVEVRDGPRPSVRLASGETVRAGKVVLATASESPALARLTGRIIPVGLKVLATAPLTAEQLGVLRWSGRECIVDSRKLFNYFRLTADNRIVFGGGAPVYGSEPAHDFSDLERELRETFPNGPVLEIAYRWGGTIDYTLDGQPIVGPISAGANVLHAGGFCGHGIALGVRAGRWVAEALAVAPRQAVLHPAFRNTAPLVPGDWLRRTCFTIASHWMRLRGV